MYQKDDKVWLEIAPDQFDKPFFFSWNLSRGLGEKFIFGGLMGDSDIVEFHKVGQRRCSCSRKNQVYFASEGKPQARAVAEAFSDSLIAAVPIASQPHPERKGVLIEVNALLLADIPGANGMLERTYRQSVQLRRAQLVDRQGARDARTASRSTSTRTMRSAA